MTPSDADHGDDRPMSESRSVMRRKNVMAGRDINDGIPDRTPSDADTPLLGSAEERAYRQGFDDGVAARERATLDARAAPGLDAAKLAHCIRVVQRRSDRALGEWAADELASIYNAGPVR